MNCLLCGHEKAHKHGKTAKGIQRYKCPHCALIQFEAING